MAIPLLWTTSDEVMFIKALGTGVFLDRRVRTVAPTPETRLVLLKKYRAALEHRRFWHGMSRTEIEMAADAQIRYVQTLVRNKE